MKLTYTQKRVVAAVLAVTVLLTAANYYLDLCYFGNRPKVVMLLNVLLVLFFVIRYGPTREEMADHVRRRKDNAEE